MKSYEELKAEYLRAEEAHRVALDKFWQTADPAERDKLEAELAAARTARHEARRLFLASYPNQD